MWQNYDLNDISGGIRVSGKIKMKNALMLIAVMIIMMAIGYIYGFYQETAKKQDSKNEEVDISKLALAGNDLRNENEDEETVTVISPSTEIVLNRFYLRCRDRIVERRKPYREELGLKKEDIQAFFVNWTVEEFNEEQLVLNREINNYCSEHYILKELEGLVSIYVPEKEDEGLELVEQTSIKVQSLPLDLQHEINNGIVVESLEQVEYLIESWQS